MSFSINPLQYSDFEATSRIWKQSFMQDRQTQLKKLGDVSYLRDDPVGAHRRFVKDLQRPTHVWAKAVGEHGEFLGSLGIEFVGFDAAEVPRFDQALLGTSPTLPDEDSTPSAGKDEEKEPISEEKQRANEMIDKLEAMENTNWTKWSAVFSPPGSPTIVLTGLTVDPAHQGRGIGSALLAWGAGLADRAGTYMWVHSSEAGYRAYAKAGFKVEGTLDVDLDEWAPAGPVEGGLGCHYLIRWMKRMPREGGVSSSVEA
jgi:GNAT superfamily N-acetyltransferase